MQIAKGTLILSPENQQFKYGITPAEALILHKLHFTYSNGTPLGDFYIQSGEARTVDIPERAAEDEEFNLGTGRTIPAKPFVPAVDHKRTQAEEISRLKRKYTGNVTENGVTHTAFVATFGTAVGVHLPETFAEIEPIIGVEFKPESRERNDHAESGRKNELLSKLRTELVEKAVGLGLKIHAQDTKESIVSAIMDKEAGIAPPVQNPEAEMVVV